MENISKIMNTYKEEQKRLTKTKKDMNLEKKDKEISSNEIEIKRQTMHIERLTEERKNYKDAIALDDIAIRNEYDKNIKSEEERLDEQRKSLGDLKEERKLLAINRDKANEEVKKKILQKMNENQDKLRKDLTAEQKKLEIETKKLKVQYDMKMIEIHEFQYQYDEKGVPTNGEEYRKMNEEALKIYEDMNKCKKDIELCKSELEKSREVISDMPKLSKYEIYDESVLDKKIEKAENEEKDIKEQKVPTEEIIKKVQRETEEQNRNYGNVHLEAGPQVDRVKINKQEQKPKNTFEIENAINNAYQQIQNDTRDITDVRKIERMINDNEETKRKSPKKEEDKTVEYIEIVEESGLIKYNIKGEEQEKAIPIKRTFENKKEKFKKLGISKMCKEIAGGKIKGALLKRKINPEIVAVLENNNEQLISYINNIYEKKKLPFDLVHNLENTNIFSKIKLNRFAKAEEKSGAWVCGKLFDKNRAIVAREKTKVIAGTVKENTQVKASKAKTDFVQKIPNKDSSLEANARVALAQKESEKELAKNVEEIMQEQEGNEI